MTNFSHLCVRCMQPLNEGETVCAHCGDDAAIANPPHTMPLGTVLSERYMIGRLLKDGGDAAVYMGYDTVLKAAITVREFFPRTLCERAEDLSLRPIRGCEQTYTDYMNKFLAHARVVARMRDLPASIPTYDIFQQNATAYTVSEWCEGVTLAQYLEARGGRMLWDDVRPLFIPLLNSLVSLHQAGVLHLGLSPEVLIMGDDGKLHVNDFAIAEARCASSELTADLPGGYAAPEQYAFGTTPSATADVYAVAAIIFRTLVGTPLPDGETRPMTNADLTVPSEVASEFPPHVASALFSALQPSVEKRLSSLALLRDRLAEAPAVAALLEDEETSEDGEDENIEYELEPSGPPIGVYIAVGIIACILLALLGFALGRVTAPPPAEGNPTNATTTMPTGTIIITDQTDVLDPNTMGSVPNVVGQSYDALRGKYVENRAIKLNGFQYSDTVPAGTVISQTPTSEEEADVTEPVYVIVSAGPEAIALPDVSGWERDHAVAYLEALGFKVQVDEVLVTAVEFGKVESSSPAKSTVLARGNTVRLRVSVKETTAPTTTTTLGSTPTSTTTTTKPSSTTVTTTTTTTAKPSSTTVTTTTTKPSSSATVTTTTTTTTTKPSSSTTVTTTTATTTAASTTMEATTTTAATTTTTEATTTTVEETTTTAAPTTTESETEATTTVAAE